MRKPPFATKWDFIVIGVIATIVAAIVGWVAFCNYYLDPM